MTSRSEFKVPAADITCCTTCCIQGLQLYQAAVHAPILLLPQLRTAPCTTQPTGRQAPTKAKSAKGINVAQHHTLTTSQPSAGDTWRPSAGDAISVPTKPRCQTTPLQVLTKLVLTKHQIHTVSYMYSRVLHVIKTRAGGRCTAASSVRIYQTTARGKLSCSLVRKKRVRLSATCCAYVLQHIHPARAAVQATVQADVI
jgi:hypothetical protein